MKSRLFKKKNFIISDFREDVAIELIFIENDVFFKRNKYRKLLKLNGKVRKKTLAVQRVKEDLIYNIR